MIRRIVFMLVVSGLFTVQANEGVEQFCTGKWPDSEVSRKLCKDKQTAAKTIIDKARAGKNQSGLSVLDYCAGKWPADFHMQNFCAEKQFEAMFKIVDLAKPKNFKREINQVMKQCLNKWLKPDFGSDWEMAVHCIDWKMRK